MMMFFVQVGNIAEIYGNVLLFGVVGMELHSNHNRSIYRNENGSLYELCVGGLLMVVFTVMVSETRQFYDQNIPDQQ